MGSRLELQTLLETILKSDHVYFQPPSNLKMVYPAIVFAKERIDNIHADDSVYLQSFKYRITVIDADPDSTIPNEVSKLPTCVFDRGFTADNLNHSMFIIIF